MAITTLPKRKPGVRRKRGSKVPTSANVPFVTPAQDPGLQATPGAFGGQEAAALGDVGTALQNVAIAKQKADARLAAAQQRIRDKQDINTSLLLVDEFEQEGQKIFDALATDNKLGDADFNKKYSEQIEQKFNAILGGSNFSNAEAKLDFQGKLLESRFKMGDTAGVKNAAALDERQMGIARKGLMTYQLDPQRAGEGFSQIISGARAKLEKDFAGSLSESSEATLMNEVVFEQFSPRFTMLIAGGSLNDARKLLNHPDVANILSPQQFRAANQRIELVEAKRVEQEVADNILFQQEADRLGIPVEQLTPSQKAGLKSNRKSPAFLSQEMFELAKLEHGTENPTTDQIKQTTRRNRAAVDPLQKIKDTLQVADGKQLNLLRFENREQAENDLEAINLGQNALASGAKPGSLVDMRTAVAKMLKLFNVSDEAIASLNLGSAPMNEILGKSLADLALTQADKISRVTNMSIKLVREVWGTAGSTRAGLEIIFEMAENIARRDLAIADLAEAESQRIQSGEPTKEELGPFNDQLTDLKREFEIFPEELAEKFKVLAQQAKQDKKVEVKRETKATKGTGEFQVPEGTKLLGFTDNGKTAIILNKEGKRKRVPREALVKFNESLKPKKPASAPRPTAATGAKSTPVKKKVGKLSKPVAPTKTAPTKQKQIEPRTPSKVKKQVAKKDKFSNTEAIIGLNQEDFERFISTTPADRRTAEVNTAISERLKGEDNKFLKEKEEFIAQARDIGDGTLTIGYGITSAAYKDLTGKTLTKETKVDKKEANQLVGKFIKKFIKPEIKVLEKKKGLTRNQEEAITSLIFNVGIGAWKKSRARKALLAGDIKKFLFEAFDPKIGFFTKNPKFLKGLQDRRAEERALFLKE